MGDDRRDDFTRYFPSRGQFFLRVAQGGQKIRVGWRHRNTSTLGDEHHNLKDNPQREPFSCLAANI